MDTDILHCVDFRALINRTLISFTLSITQRFAVYFSLSYGSISSPDLLQLKIPLAVLQSSRDIAFSWGSQLSELIYIQEEQRFNDISFERIIMFLTVPALLSELMSDHFLPAWPLTVSVMSDFHNS